MKTEGPTMKNIDGDHPTPTPEKTRGSRYFPLAIDLAGLRCLVVGGGRIGTRKALALVDAGAEVTVLSPDLSERLRESAQLGRIHWQRAGYEPAALEGRFMVVAATSDPALNLRIGREADARGILACVASSAADSRVIFPAVHRSETITITVHTDGRDCRRAKALRDAIAAELS